jgi:hypothetical protein
MDGELSMIMQAIDAGGNAALLLCVYFLVRASERLARIEKALEKFMEK